MNESNTWAAQAVAELIRRLLQRAASELRESGRRDLEASERLRKAAR